MKDQTVREGEPVQFQCRIAGVPDPVVQWYYNNQIIKPSKYFQLLANPATGTYSLSIAGVFPEDDGVYKCVARNPAGEVTCIANLRVIRMFTNILFAVFFSLTKAFSCHMPCWCLSGKTSSGHIWISGWSEVSTIRWMKPDGRECLWIRGPMNTNWNSKHF